MHSVQYRNTHTFARSPAATIQRAAFDRSHGHKTTFNEGYLIPVYWDEVLPGDTYNLRMTAFARMSTPIYPIMDNVYMESFFFFVPNRLVWSNWERFNGAQDNPTDSTDYVLPTLTTTAVTGVPTGSIFDYYGIPTLVPGIELQTLPLRCYNIIWNQWFRDESLQNSVVQNMDDGPDAVSDYNLLRRGKRKDYFTSALPWPQKINDGTVVEIPLGTTAPVYGNGQNVAWHTATQSGSLFVNSGVQSVNIGGPSGATESFFFDENPAVGHTGLYTDLSAATAATINQLRQSFQMQRLFEHDARGGTRYTEIVRSHFGVISADARLQRPEYLGGGASMVNINPVAQTSPTSGTNAQGDLAAFGTAHMINHGFIKSFTEHGHIIGLVATRADLSYQQGLFRPWSRSTRYDFFWPSLSHIGEQAILNQEIYAQGTSADQDVFGYQERYGEYRYKPSLITGLFRSNATGTLDAWHLAQDFGSLPTLGSTFIVEDAPMERIEAVPDGADFLFDSQFTVKNVRPMSLYGVPGWVDHF